MKTLKLKTPYYFILSFFALAVFMTSCSKDDATTESATDSTEKLKKSLEADPDFYLLQSLEGQLYNEVSQALAAAGLSGADMEAAFEDEASAKAVEAALKSSKAKDLSDQVQTVASKLDSKYSSLHDAAITEAEYVNRRNDGFSNIGPDGEINNRWCGWKYYACRGAVFASKIACKRYLPSWICNIGGAYAVSWCKRKFC